MPATATAAGTPGAALSATASSSPSVWEHVHVKLLELLLGEAYDATAAVLLGDCRQQDIKAGRPIINAHTWQEAAARYLAAAATATYLSQGETKSSAQGSAALSLPGALSSMEAADWAQFLVGGLKGLNPQQLVSRIALLPQGNSETAAEALVMLEDAAALAAAEAMVQATARAAQLATAKAGVAPEADQGAVAANGVVVLQRQQQQAGQVDKQAVADGAVAVASATAPAPAAATAESPPTNQVPPTPALAPQAVAAVAGDAALLVCRRILQQLMLVTAPSSSAEQQHHVKEVSAAHMAFFSQELGPLVLSKKDVAGSHKGVDLHAVAVRLDAGLYHHTGQPLQVRRVGCW